MNNFLILYIKKRLNRKLLIKIGFYVILLFALIGGRGYALANKIGGRYPVSSLLSDVMALGFAIIVIHAINILFRRFVTRFVNFKNVSLKRSMSIIQIFLLLIIAVPFLFSLLLLHPQRIVCTRTPSTIGLEYFPVDFKANGNDLSGWFILANKPAQPIVLIAHGFNAHKENFLYPAHLLNAEGYNVFLFDFRAHGDSAGWISTLGIREAADVKAAYDWLRSAYPSRPIHALGYSMGGAAVVNATAEYGIFDKIILDSSYTSVERVAKATKLKFLGPVRDGTWQMVNVWVKIISGVDFKPKQTITRSTNLKNHSIMLIHGDSDAIVPCVETLKLYESLHKKPELWIQNNTGHLSTILHPDYKKRLMNFLKDPS